MAEPLDELPIRSREDLRAWLEGNHSDSPGVWLVRFKKDSGGPHVPYDDVVEEALCFGWVDSQPRAVDGRRSALRLTPRSPASGWSAANKKRVTRLREAGLMRPAGEAVIAEARANGAWNALDAAERLIEPDDLAAVLDELPGARAHWDGFPPSARKAILTWILAARRPGTRARRVAETAREAAAGRRANQWRPKDR